LAPVRVRGAAKDEGCGGKNRRNVKCLSSL
jgi:hypothetical protein